MDAIIKQNSEAMHGDRTEGMRRGEWRKCEKKHKNEG